MRRKQLTLGHIALLTLLAACGDEGEEADHHGNSDESSADHHGGSGTETSTGAVCPEGSTLTYESFGKSFMDKYCVTCHSTALVGAAARKGAPEGHDFDVLAGIVPTAEHIDQYAAIGPNASNQKMPPTDPKPTDEERTQLGQWLACEASR